MGWWMTRVGAVTCLVSFGFALAWDQISLAFIALFGSFFWIQGLLTEDEDRPSRLQKRFDRTQNLRMHRFTLGLLIVMSLPLSSKQSWQDWSWEWTAVYAVAALWTWFAPLIRRKMRASK